MFFPPSRTYGAVLLLLGCLVTPGVARTFFQQEEVFQKLFPDAAVERVTHYLTPEQEQEIEKRSGSKLRASIIYAYRLIQNGELLETAYFDQHRVRTLPETLMVGVSPEGQITRVVVMAFNEPLDYMPRDRWYAQFVGKRLEKEFRLKRQIDGVTGATLTARSTTEAGRRVLAIHEVLLQETAP